MTAVPMLEAVLGPDELQAYERDLEALASLERVQLEDARGTRTCDLQEVFDAVEAHRCRRALVTYAFQGTYWVDTLLPTAQGLRLLRCAPEGESPR